MSKIINIQEIMQLLPHRFPFLLVDRVVDYLASERLTAIKNVTINEPFFTGHFPQRPVMPGVLMIEAIAQAGGLLYFQTHIDNGTPDAGLMFLAGIDDARFKRIVEPGDQLRIEVKPLKIRGTIWRLKGEIFVDDKLACSAEILSAQ
ncbi:MAG: 3-hydroxyacyl-ACP dehydratase FabZ [Gammaproteobacteria bacterium]|nr:3-hydroxyacyl-ACP dehydratase FabZ [Gammaproteobacteria bacterium]MCD8541919.1 3-hydroxyacyl-ACP dehydratase FabZ [Gammaproteobacteria bacterium]